MQFIDVQSYKILLENAINVQAEYHCNLAVIVIILQQIQSTTQILRCD